MSIPADALGPLEEPRTGLPDRVRDILRATGPAARQRRLWLGWGISVAAVWVLSGLALLVLPPSYASNWTFILPAGSSGATVSLDQIGQTSTTPSQPFGSVSLSPKVIYKEILRSEQVLREAAQVIGVSEKKLAKPRVKLIDETALMVCTVNGRTPEEAQRRAKVFISVFNAQLESLRRDEIERRAESVRESLVSYQAKLDEARRRILASQQESGVVSINQFNEATLSMELLRRRLAEITSDLEKLRAEQKQMMARVGLEPESAIVSLKLIADPVFVKLATDFADAHAAHTQAASRLGPRNPALIELEQKRASTLSALARSARAAGADDTFALDRFALIANSTHQADLLKGLLGHEATIEGRRREVAALEKELADRRQELKLMSSSSSRLEDLKKDHLVAEAVFTTAVARLDTNKTDVYASYPMVQVLAEPDLADSDHHPLLIFAVLAGLFGSVMMTVGWGLVWLRPIWGRSVATSG